MYIILNFFIKSFIIFFKKVFKRLLLNTLFEIKNLKNKQKLTS